MLMPKKVKYRKQQRGRLAVVALGLFKVPLLVPHAAQAAMGLPIGRIQLERSPVAGQGIVVLLLRRQQAGGVRVDAG